MGRALGLSFLQLCLSVFLLWTFLFFFLRILPGGPFENLENQMNPAVVESLKSQYNLDLPLFQQYQLSFFNFLKGDLGISLTNPEKKNSEIILSKISVSFQLGGATLLLTLVVFMIFWCLCTFGWLTERQVLNVSYFLTSLPTLLVAPLVLWFVSAKLDFFQLSDPRVAMLLGAWVLCLRMSGVWLRIYFNEQSHLKSSVGSQFIRSLGFSEAKNRSLWMFKSCLLPTLALALPSVAGLLAGTLLVETIFNISGIGYGLVTSLLERDYTLVTSYVLVFGMLYIISQFLFEALAKFLDPRIHESK